MGKTKRKYKGGWCFKEGTAIDQAKSVILDAGLHETKNREQLDSMINDLKQKKNCDKYPVFINALKFINKKPFEKLTQRSFGDEGLKKYARDRDPDKLTLFESYGEEFYNRANKPVRLEESVYKSYLKYILEGLGEIDQDSELHLTAVVKPKYTIIDRPGSSGSDRSTTTSTTTTSSNDSGDFVKKKPKPNPKTKQNNDLHSGASVLSTVNPNGESFDRLNILKIKPDTAHSPSGARGQSSRIRPSGGGKSKRNKRSNNKTKRKYKKQPTHL